MHSLSYVWHNGNVPTKLQRKWWNRNTIRSFIFHPNKSRKEKEITQRQQFAYRLGEVCRHLVSRDAHPHSLSYSLSPQWKTYSSEKLMIKSPKRKVVWRSSVSNLRIKHIHAVAVCNYSTRLNRNPHRLLANMYILQPQVQTYTWAERRRRDGDGGGCRISRIISGSSGEISSRAQTRRKYLPAINIRHDGVCRLISRQPDSHCYCNSPRTSQSSEA